MARARSSAHHPCTGCCLSCIAITRMINKAEIILDQPNRNEASCKNLSVVRRHYIVFLGLKKNQINDSARKALSPFLIFGFLPKIQPIHIATPEAQQYARDNKISGTGQGLFRLNSLNPKSYTKPYTETLNPTLCKPSNTYSNLRLVAEAESAPHPPKSSEASAASSLEV